MIRTQAPSFNTIDAITLIQPEKQVLKNGLPLFTINAGKEPLVKIEWVFNNLNWSTQEPLTSAACNTLLNEGTSQHTSAQIADFVDFYGAFLQVESSFDQSMLTLYCLTKNLEKMLPLVKEILTDSVFAEHELATYRKNQQQKMQVNLQKNDYVARKAFNQAVFGEHSIYGYFAQAADYDQLSRTSLLQFFQQIYRADNCTMIASGNIESPTVQLIDQYFGENDWKRTSTGMANYALSPAKARQQYIAKKDALQSAIRVGKPFIGKTHPDYAGTRVLNTVLGGYFGSRLMSNIREDKGYTYGIGSNIISMDHGSYFYIASEVGADVCSNALTEVYKEIKRLQEELVPASELDLVRNYMLGSFLGSLENAFSYADKFKGVYFSGLDYTYYDQLIETIKTISPQKIQELANTYLQVDSMYEVVVGKK